MTLPSTVVEPALPAAVGPLSATIVDLLQRGRPALHVRPFDVPVCEADPYGLDLQLALYICYELHYRGFAGVNPKWEWNPALLHVRGRLEESFLAAVRQDVGEIGPGETAEAEMDKLAVEPLDGEGPSYYLRDKGTFEQMREYFVHRSVYHLKEADPHAWAIPRLSGHAKAAFVAVEFDEYGGGRGDHVHAHLFAELMHAAGLDASYLAYLGNVSAYALASVNLMSLFGLHRELRGATIGHFASTEITSPPGSRRLVDALERMGAPEPCVAFYREHVVADAVHEQVVRTDVVGDLVAREPHLDRDVVFGIRARDVVEDRLASHLMECWSENRSSLRRPLG
ncbi:iron-containing redox enzyme family protein [Mycobacterium sp. IDR2000157661]|uniref:iron-containing redox enzyme family protein n=1 Tax=Mycobacterium sp. IDR2000157661 TaxID=2867005 RepID=UPI001EEE0E1D|nr:iron-containing redox enzyme family protein [Mycobacterium sp. IDR2000157661]ULE35644.1 iron-containing redox enzyme family protein [Mycobacterium sp. IDR2000157661]